MTLRKRTTGTLTVDSGGAATAAVGLGSAYAEVMGFEFKGITGSDVNTTIKLTDADGRVLFAATALDSTTDDSTTKDTEQSTSTKGVAVRIGPVESKVYDKGGDPSANTEGMVQGMFAKSPVTVDIAAGTEAETHVVHLWVRG